MSVFHYRKFVSFALLSDRPCRCESIFDSSLAGEGGQLVTRRVLDGEGLLFAFARPEGKGSSQAKFINIQAPKSKKYYKKVVKMVQNRALPGVQHAVDEIQASLVQN